MAAAAGSSKQATSAADLPTDATAIRNILKTMGVEAHEPRVVNMLLDFMYSYVSGVLSDASAFAEQVGRRPGEVENEDVTLAISTRARHSFVPRPPQEALRQIADQVNSKPLPDVNANLGYGLRLADEAHLLVQPNWRIDPFHDKKKEQQDAGGQ